MRSRSRNKQAQGEAEAASNSKTGSLISPHQIFYQGEGLVRLLKLLEREIETARIFNTNLPHKIWLKHFSVGVNDVTRVLERMPPVAAAAAATGSFSRLDVSNRDSADNSGPTLQLQAILLASDCNPRWLTKHLPSLASSRQVPVIYVKDKGGSLRLGELVKLKTAIAIGVKARGDAINKFIEDIIDGNEIPDMEA